MKDKLKARIKAQIKREMEHRRADDAERARLRAKHAAEAPEVARITRDHDRQGVWVNERYR